MVLGAGSSTCPSGESEARGQPPPRLGRIRQTRPRRLLAPSTLPSAEARPFSQRTDTCTPLCHVREGHRPGGMRRDECSEQENAAAAPHPRADLDRLVVPSNHGTAEILLASTVEAPLRHGSAGLGRTCSLRSTICFLTLTGTYPMPTFASASLTSSTSRNWPRAREGRSRRSIGVPNCRSALVILPGDCACVGAGRTHCSRQRDQVGDHSMSVASVNRLRATSDSGPRRSIPSCPAASTQACSKRCTHAFAALITEPRSDGSQ